MPGGMGPSVTLHTPDSPLTNFSEVLGFIQSPKKVMSDALGARMRKVTIPPDFTSGETTLSGACAKAMETVSRTIAVLMRFCRFYLNSTTHAERTAEFSN